MTTKERIDEKRKHLRTGRAVLTALTTLAAVLALSLSGCAGTSGGSSAGKAQETATETSGESVSNKNASGKSVSTEGISTENRSGEEGSPAAAASEGPSAADPASEEAAVYSCLIDACAESLGADEYDVTIPYAVILGKDESDPEDIRVLLTGSVECWNLEEGILEAGASAEVTGAVHLKKTGDDYEATSFENVWDGEDYEKTAKQIFGDHYDAFTKLDSETKEAARKQAIKDYVTRNGLDITAYKDFDADPVDL